MQLAPALIAAHTKTSAGVRILGLTSIWLSTATTISRVMTRWPFPQWPPVQQARNDTMLHFTGVTLTKAGGFNFVHPPSGGLTIGLRVSTAHNRLQVLIGLNVREGSMLSKKVLRRRQESRR